MSIENFYITPTFMFDVTVEFIRKKPRAGSKTKTKHFKVEAQNQSEASVRVMNKLQHSKRIAKRFKRFYVKSIRFTDKPVPAVQEETMVNPLDALFAT